MTTELPGLAPPAAASELRRLLRIAGPLALVQFGYQLMGVVDTAFAGRIDATALGATGLGASLFFGVSIIGIGVALAQDPLASQALGAGEPARARQLLWQGYWAAAILAVPLTLGCIALALALERFGVAPDLAAETRRYLWARLPSLVLLLASVSLRSYMQAAHVTRAVLLATFWANVVNAGADYLLAFGDVGLVRLGLAGIGLPAFGVVGIGWATTLSTAVQVAVLALAARSLDAGPLPGGWRRPSLPLLRRIFGIGLPIGTQLLAEVGIFSTVQVLMASIGEVASASHQVALMLASLTFSICLGVGAATSVQVGRAIGRGDAAGTRRAGLSGIGLGAGFMLVMALVMWTFPERLARLLSDDSEVVHAAARLIRIAGAFQIADGVQAVAAGALRGAGVTRWALVASLIAYWGIGMPVALALAWGAGLGPAGLWWGLTTGLATAALALAWRFASISARPIARLTVA